MALTPHTNHIVYIIPNKETPIHEEITVPTVIMPPEKGPPLQQWACHKILLRYIPDSNLPLT